MRRGVFILLCVFSLLLCIAAGALWWRSWRHPAMDEDRFSWLSRSGERFTLRSDAGRLTLFAPPAGNLDAPAAMPDEYRQWDPPEFGDRLRARLLDPLFVVTRPSNLPPATARQAAAGLRNEQTIWFALLPADTDSSGPFDARRQAGAFFLIDTPAFLLGERARTMYWNGVSPTSIRPTKNSFTDIDATAALLLALENPGGFAVAHLLLARRHGYSNGPAVVQGRLDHAYLIEDGLQVGFQPRDATNRFECVVGYEPAQLPVIREQWHRRLDVVRMSAPWWALTAGTAGLPLIWISRSVTRAATRRRRSRAGKCLVCGYDLRSSRAHCPECGTAV